jgi:hypothetical protein
MAVDNKPVPAEWVKRIEAEQQLGKDLTALLFPYVGETGKNEGATDTLKRLLRELDARRERATA